MVSCPSDLPKCWDVISSFQSIISNQSLASLIWSHVLNIIETGSCQASLHVHFVCACSDMSYWELSAPWTVACQPPLSRDSPGKSTGVGSHFLIQGDLPDPGIKPVAPALQEDSLPLSHQGRRSIGGSFAL